MKKKKEPEFTYKDNYTKCEFVDNKYGRKYVGEAYCNPVDEDFKSLITGSTIAEIRMHINMMTTYKNDLRIKLEGLNQLLYSMRQSKKFDPTSYPVKMLYRQIRITRDDIETIKDCIAEMKADLKNYIDGKEKVYQILRAKNNEQER